MEKLINELLQIAKEQGIIVFYYKTPPTSRNLVSSYNKIELNKFDTEIEIANKILKHFYDVQGRYKAKDTVFDFEFPTNHVVNKYHAITAI